MDRKERRARHHARAQAFERELKIKQLMEANPGFTRKDAEMIVVRFGPNAVRPLQAGIRKDSKAIDLQAVEVPTGNQFNTDDFNSYMGIMSTLGKTKFYNDMVDDYYTANRQAMDIEMENMGTMPKKPINPKTGRPFETMEQYKAIQELKKGMLRARLEEQGGKSSTRKMEIRRAKDSPLPGDIVDAKLEPGEYVLNRNAVKAIGKERLDKINNKIAPRFSDKVKSKSKNILDRVRAGAYGDYKDYLQTGGQAGTSEQEELDNYLKQRYRIEPDEVEQVDLRGQEDDMDFGMTAKDYEELGEKGLEDAYNYGKKVYGGTKDILTKIYNRFGGDAARGTRNKYNMANATDSEGNPITLEDAKRMSEYGLGKVDYAQVAGQFGQRVLDDLQTGIGAGIIGAKNLGIGARDLYNKAKQKYGEKTDEIYDYLSDDTGYEKDFDKVMRGEARGSNMQRVGRSASMLGSIFDQLASYQGFGEGPDFDQFRPKKNILEDVNVQQSQLGGFVRQAMRNVYGD